MVGLRNRSATNRTGCVSGDYVMCLTCGERFNTEKVCRWIYESAIEILFSDVKVTLNYVCCACRGKKCGNEHSGVVGVVRFSSC